MQLSTDRRLPFDAPAAEVWAAMGDVDSYQSWWPWLRTFQARALGVGEIWKCEIVSPLRYTVAFTLKFDVVAAPFHIEASMRGDIVGGAWIDVEERGDQCDVWIRSEIFPASTFLQRLTKFAYPIAKWGHDTVITRGAHQFQAKALSSSGASGTTTSSDPQPSP